MILVAFAGAFAAGAAYAGDDLPAVCAEPGAQDRDRLAQGDDAPYACLCLSGPAEVCTLARFQRMQDDLRLEQAAHARDAEAAEVAAQQADQALAATIADLDRARVELDRVRPAWWDRAVYGVAAGAGATLIVWIIAAALAH